MAQAATNQTATLTPANDLRPIKPPVRLPGEWAWLWWTLAAVALVAIVATWWLRRRRKPAAAASVPVIPPHVRARQRLAEALRFISEPDRFCTAVSHTLRVYLEERFHLHAPERTTEEFLIELQASPALNEAQKKSLQQFLQSCDLVKFARFEPTETVLRELHESALRLVDETQFNSATAIQSGPNPIPPPLPPVPPVPPAMPALPAAATASRPDEAPTTPAPTPPPVPR
jgi:hypothetical protein